MTDYEDLQIIFVSRNKHILVSITVDTIQTAVYYVNALLLLYSIITLLNTLIGIHSSIRELKFHNTIT